MTAAHCVVFDDIIGDGKSSVLDRFNLYLASNLTLIANDTSPYIKGQVLGYFLFVNVRENA